MCRIDSKVRSDESYRRLRRRLLAGVNNAPEDANKLFAAEASELKKTLGRIASVDPNAGVALVWAIERRAKWAS